MRRALRPIASPVLTLAGFGLLAAGIMLRPSLPAWPAAPFVLPLALLALNLAAAIAVRPALRRGGLGLFHVAMLAVLLLAGWGRLTHFDGRVEVGEGTTLDADQVEVTGEGPWHARHLRELAFRQDAWQVDYAAGLKRGHTRSRVVLPDGGAAVVGDDTPLVIDGYRLYTTPNKGLAVALRWQAGGEAATAGLLHLPSYPFYDYMQENRWRTPDGRTLLVKLRIAQAVPQDAAWTLDPHALHAVLVVDAGEGAHELRAGETLRVGAATLHYDGLAGWMGYRIFYDPTLWPMLVAALTGVLGLAVHFWRRWRPMRRHAAQGATA